ncbi:MAG: hypothetical protein HYZ53_30130 [Planctomycetes bacterium]|nr:hypothetical protein [Planctomycetota bacterium]
MASLVRSIAILLVLSFLHRGAGGAWERVRAWWTGTEPATTTRLLGDLPNIRLELRSLERMDLGLGLKGLSPTPKGLTGALPLVPREVPRLDLLGGGVPPSLDGGLLGGRGLFPTGRTESLSEMVERLGRTRAALGGAKPGSSVLGTR